MSNNADWERQLQRLIDEHNWRHAKKPKNISNKTMEERARILFLAFNRLRALGFEPAPRNLDGKHVQNLLWFWTADPQIEKRCKLYGVSMPRKSLSSATLQARLSTLRVFCRWIGKTGMVLAPERYVSDPALVRRTYVAQEDKSWSAKGLDAAEIVARISGIDPFIAAMVDIILHFGLRKKESVMLAPHWAVVPATIVPIPNPTAEFYLMLIQGTKGGRLRFVPIDTEAKWRAIDRAQQVAVHRHSRLGAPGRSLKQVLNRFAYVMRVVGITKDQLGVTAHGLRHQYANDLYFALTDIQSPVRGGQPTDLQRHVEACLEISSQLGHARQQATHHYTSSASLSRRQSTSHAQTT
jgi:integrase